MVQGAPQFRDQRGNPEDSSQVMQAPALWSHHSCGGVAPAILAWACVMMPAVALPVCRLCLSALQVRLSVLKREEELLLREEERVTQEKYRHIRSEQHTSSNTPAGTHL